jgi:uncharacterized protein (TIGR02246 family)
MLSVFCLAVLSSVLLPTPQILAADDPTVAAVKASSEEMATAFNAAKAESLADMFLPKGEFVDEHGDVHQGTDELKQLFAAFFTKFPQAKMRLEIDSIRQVDTNVVLEDGTRFITAGEKNEARARLRYTTVRVNSAGKWKIASLREYADEAAATPGERLQTLAWLVGDWVNEGSDAKVHITYRWSNDKNYLLGDFSITRPEKGVVTSTQRIGWDPLTSKIHSWLFDADGGYAEGNWTAVGDAWVVKSSTVNPDGQTASATMTFTNKDKDRFTVKGSDRIVGDDREPDFELTVVRRAPVAGK